MLLSYVFWAAAAYSQTAQFIPPVRSYVFDGVSHSLRPVIGLPGGAYLGQKTVSSIDAATVSPNGIQAIVRQGESLQFIPRLDSPDDRHPFDPGPRGASDILWSGDSRNLVVLSADRSGFWPFRVEGDHLESGSLVESGADCHLMAVSAEGTQVVVKCAAADGAEVLVFDGTASPRSLGVFSDPRAAVVDSPGSRILLLDRVSAQLLSWPLTGTATASVLLDAGDDIADPVGLALIDGRQALIASGAQQRLTLHSLDDRSRLGEWKTDISPSFLVPVKGSRLWLINDLRQPGDILFAATTDPEPRIFFIASQE
jgi:hypothetical protein